MTERRVSFDIDVKKYEEYEDSQGEYSERERQLTDYELEELMKDVFLDIQRMPEGDWDIDGMRITNLRHSNPDEERWSNDDMRAAFEAGLRGMGRGLWMRWLRIRHYDNTHKIEGVKYCVTCNAVAADHSHYGPARCYCYIDDCPCHDYKNDGTPLTGGPDWP